MSFNSKEEREDGRVIELTQNSIIVDGPEMGSQIEYHISNGQALRRATELELDVVEPSIICHSTTATEKVVMLDKNIRKTVAGRGMNTVIYFTVQFPLKTEKYQEDILDKRFEIGRQIYNSLLSIIQKRYREMIKTKKYRNLISQLSGDKNKDKSTWKKIKVIRKQFGMSEYSFYTDVQKVQHHFSKNIDTSTARSIATNLW